MSLCKIHVTIKILYFFANFEMSSAGIPDGFKQSNLLISMDYFQNKKTLAGMHFPFSPKAKTNGVVLIGVGMPPDTTHRRILFLKLMG